MNLLNEYLFHLKTIYDQSFYFISQKQNKIMAGYLIIK